MEAYKEAGSLASGKKKKKKLKRHPEKKSKEATLNAAPKDTQVDLLASGQGNVASKIA